MTHIVYVCMRAYMKRQNEEEEGVRRKREKDTDLPVECELVV